MDFSTSTVPALLDWLNYPELLDPSEEWQRPRSESVDLLMLIDSLFATEPPTLVTSLATLLASLPQNSTEAPRTRKKRKRLTPDQKQAHNKIERKYRTSINAKIELLRTVVPSAAAAMNKGAVLDEATAYILQLQQRLRELESGPEMPVPDLELPEVKLEHELQVEPELGF